MLSTFVVGILGTLLTHNPLTDLYSENGLLTQGRNLAFSAAQASPTTALSHLAAAKPNYNTSPASSPMPPCECRCS